MAAAKRPASGVILAAGIILILVSILSGCASDKLTPINLTTLVSPFSAQVYIGGEVNNPGIYPLRSDDTLAELVKAAGGLKSGSEFSQVRVSFILPAEAPATQQIDINLAETWLLEALPGIGPSLAAAIIEYRTQNGPFRSVEELTRVNGIGSATLERLREFITVSLPGQPPWP
jgi:competence protein ComEA